MTSLFENLKDDEKTLVLAARESMKNAYCKYSGFQVGAAVECENGDIFDGANHENASYGATICAERSALTSALSKGHRKFNKIAIATQLEEPCSPCGVCRQFLIEFGNYKVILASSESNAIIETSTYELLPYAFTPKSLETFENQTTSN